MAKKRGGFKGKKAPPFKKGKKRRTLKKGRK